MRHQVNQRSGCSQNHWSSNTIWHLFQRQRSYAQVKRSTTRHTSPRLQLQLVVVRQLHDAKSFTPLSVPAGTTVQTKNRQLQNFLKAKTQHHRPFEHWGLPNNEASKWPWFQKFCCPSSKSAHLREEYCLRGANFINFPSSVSARKKTLHVLAEHFSSIVPQAHPLTCIFLLCWLSYIHYCVLIPCVSAIHCK